MLHDRATIHVRAGAGGDGCASFRREAHVPKGGPDGGDGGRGGDVVLVCDDSLRDLREYHHRPHRRAGKGGHGQGAQRHGADGEPLVLAVPPGTVVELPDGRASTSSSRASARWSRAAASGGGATSASRRRRARRRGWPSGGSPATSWTPTCGSSCSPMSAWWGCRTPGNRRSWPV